MKNRKIVIVLGIVILILIIGGSFYLGKNYSKLTTKTDTRTFLYSNFDDKIPEDKKISFEEYQNFINNICVQMGEAPTSVVLAEEKAPDNKYCKNGELIDHSVNGGTPCTYQNFATVCGNKYIIHGGSSSNGPASLVYYGIFELK